MENLGINMLEILVKLASLGAAGISIYAVFTIGKQIFNLPNDVSAVKAALLKRFMATCMILAVICGVSTWANAHFTHSKVVDARDKTEDVKKDLAVFSKNYEDQRIRIEKGRVALRDNFLKLRNNFEGVQLSPNQQNFIVSQRSIIQNQIEGLNQIKISPLKDILRE